MSQTINKKDFFVIPDNGAINCPGATTDNHKAVECFAPVFTTADPTVMSDRDQSRKSDDPYKKGNHPASNLMSIKNYWPTPIAEEQLDLPDDIKIGLMETIAMDGSNIFIYDESHPHANSIRQFEIISNELIREYLIRAYGLKEADGLDIEARAFGNLQTFGGRTYPHYHHGFDGVLITYLTAGEEWAIDDDFKIRPITDADKIHPTEENLPTESKLGYTRDVLQGSGNLILCDPRPAINYPYCNKAIAWKATTGLTLLHPAYVWHETNPFLGNGVRVSFVINYRVLTKTNQQVVKPLASI